MKFFPLILLLLVLCARNVFAAGDEVFTSARQINALQLVPDGALWAATSGGVLRRASDGTWTKWTRQDGLPAHEAQRVVVENGVVRVLFPDKDASFEDDHWRLVERAPTQNLPASTCSVFWHGTNWTANLAGLKNTNSTRALAFPPSTGTHISALLVRDGQLWAALFGDGLWCFDGANWTRVDLQLPDAARDITALVGDAHNLWLGTRREGIWQYDFAAKMWRQFVRDEPFDTNVQNIVAFGDALWFSTLEDGLVMRSGQSWRHFESELSSNAPRQMVSFHNALYVRHGGGEVDCFDGENWQKNVFPRLPRGKVLALCADENHLYLGQWGGWSEWDGENFAHFLRFPELQGLPPLSLHASTNTLGNTLWFGTQSRGLVEATLVQNDYRLQVWDERQALPDDWITAIAGDKNAISAGTFVGGAVWREGDKWRSAPELSGQNVTALAQDGAVWWIATRHGLWRRDATGKVTDCQARLPFLDSELQALQLTPQGLWIGARTGIFFVSRATLDGLAVP